MPNYMKQPITQNQFKKILKGAFTPNVKSMLYENLGGILGGTQCYMGDYLILSES